MSSDVAARTDDDLDFEPDPDQEMSKPPQEEDDDEVGQIKFVSVSKLRYTKFLAGNQLNELLTHRIGSCGPKIHIVIFTYK